jgi:hypothetical protein
MMPDAGAIPALDAQDQGLDGPLAPPNPQEVLDALLRAVQNAAEAGAGQDTREISEGSKAALAYAQAWAILHPQLDPAGLPLDHHLQMEQTRGQNAVALEALRGQNALAVAKESARAPTPAKSVRVRRDSSGQPTQYDVSGG